MEKHIFVTIFLSSGQSFDVSPTRNSDHDGLQKKLTNVLENVFVMLCLVSLAGLLKVIFSLMVSSRRMNVWRDLRVASYLSSLFLLQCFQGTYQKLTFISQSRAITSMPTEATSWYWLFPEADEQSLVFCFAEPLSVADKLQMVPTMACRPWSWWKSGLWNSVQGWGVLYCSGTGEGTDDSNLPHKNKLNIPLGSTICVSGVQFFTD